ncbi:DNA-binding protein [Geomonas sp. Red32]|uniref:DNA-binding protein n=1 Tax=Geomonas sp. Red32 TaxID=2912856 RepID=UPI00202CC386|nr:DNA-binding protein [Geomonas sp. Red32]MCM0081282.1 DNA-binding protein [Geomonas sp. Red32]
MKISPVVVSSLLALAIPVAALCADAPAASAPAPAASAPTAASAPAAPGVPTAADKKEKKKHTMMDMMKSGASSSSSGASISPVGTVTQTMDAGGYTYAELDNEGKKSWVAFPAEETKVGDKLSFAGCAEMNSFESKSLNRTFETIMFCGPPTVAKEKKKAAKVGGAIKVEKVEKAKGANAYTVAEIFGKRAALAGKTVVVRGTAVKVSEGIMGKNWVHLQDGTGNAKAKTNDLVVTTKAKVEDGEIVTLSGKLAKDKDFGAGYKFKAIVEDAVLK